MPSRRSRAAPSTIVTRTDRSRASGSTAVTAWSRPSIFGIANRTRVTVATPGVRSIWSPSDGEKRSPTTLETTRSPWKLSAIVLSMLAFDDEPTMAIVVTRARPIISADAVAAVRRGLRRAFSPANRPTVPKAREYTTLIVARNGRPITGLATAAPSRATRMPPPTQ